MSRPTTALTAAVFGVALAGTVTLGQQSLRRSSPGSDPAPFDAMASARGARHLLRNGQDYIGYQEYERALTLLREAESRQAELTATEIQTLKQAIERAQRGLREAADGSRPTYAKSEAGGRPGAIAAAKPASTRMPDPIQLTGATLAEPSASAGTVPAGPLDLLPDVEPSMAPPVVDAPEPRRS